MTLPKEAYLSFRSCIDHQSVLYLTVNHEFKPDMQLSVGESASPGAASDNDNGRWQSGRSYRILLLSVCRWQVLIFSSTPDPPSCSPAATRRYNCWVNSAAFSQLKFAALFRSQVCNSSRNWLSVRVWYKTSAMFSTSSGCK
jgi:hypothetical protein